MKLDFKYDVKNPFLNGFFILYLVYALLLIGLQWLTRFYFSIFATHQLHLANQWYGISQDIAVVGYGLVLLSISHLLFSVFSNRAHLILTVQWLILGLIAIIVFLIQEADILLFNSWGTKIDSSALAYMKYPSEVFANISLKHWVIISIAICVFTWIWNRLYKTVLARLNALNLNLTSKITAFVYMLIGVLMARGGTGKMPVLISDAYKSDNQIDNLVSVNSCWNFFYQCTQMNKMDEIDHFFKKDYHFNYFDKFYNPHHSTKHAWNPIYSSLKQQPNVIMIILEGQGAELSKYFGGKEANITPNLDKLAQEGFTATSMMACGNRTSKGLNAIFFDYPGQVWNELENDPKNYQKLPSLTKEFTQRGYSSSFFYGGQASFANMGPILKAGGVHTIKDETYWEQLNAAHKGAWGYHDEVIYNHLLTEVSNLKQPFFASYLTLSSHEPFDVVNNQKLSDNEKMKAAVVYSDQQLGKFMDAFNKSSLANNTVVVIVADHGKDLHSDYTYYGSTGYFRIPFVVYGKCLPEQLKHKNESRVVSQTDIHASLCDLLFGKQLFPSKFSRSIFNCIPFDKSVAFSNLNGVMICHTHEGVYAIDADNLSVSKKSNNPGLNWKDSFLLEVQQQILKNIYRLP